MRTSGIPQPYRKQFEKKAKRKLECVQCSGHHYEPVIRVHMRDMCPSCIVKREKCGECGAKLDGETALFVVAQKPYCEKCYTEHEPTGQLVKYEMRQRRMGN